MLPLTKIVTLLQDRKLYKVAAVTGIHENTIRAIAKGQNTNPTLNTLKALSDYFTQEQSNAS